MGFSRRTTLVGFRGRTLVVDSELQMEIYSGFKWRRGGIRTESDNGELQMENFVNGL